MENITLRRKLLLPENLEDGEYYFYIEFISNGKKSVTVEKNNIKER